MHGKTQTPKHGLRDDVGLYLFQATLASGVQYASIHFTPGADRLFVSKAIVGMPFRTKLFSSSNQYRNLI